MIYEIPIILAAFFVMWIIFVNAMWLRDNQEKVPKWLRYPAMFLFVVGFLYDVLLNIVYGSLMFLDPPDFKTANVQWKGIGFPTLSERMKDYLRDGREGSFLIKYRWYLSRFMCRYMIEPWDKGHCGIGYVE